MDFSIFNGYILRIPAYPFSFFQSIQTMTEDELLDLFNDINIREAIFLASPLLYSQLIQLTENKVSDKKREKLVSSFFKYLIRLSTRPTPFGSFAGTCFSNVINNKTKYIIDQDKEHIKYTRLSIQTIEILTQYVIESIEYPNDIPLYINNTLYKLPLGNYRYIKISYSNNKKYSEIINLQYSEFIDKAIMLAKTGVTSSRFCKVFNKEYGIEKSDTIEFLKNLLNDQILISELTPQIVTHNNLEDLYEKIKKFELEKKCNNNNIFKLINKIRNNLSCDVSLLNLHKIELELKKLHIPLNEKLFHCDLSIKSKKISLNNRIIENGVKTGVEVLSRLVDIDTIPIASFKEEIIKRYGHKKIKLVDALDPIFGIGYNENRNLNNTCPLLDNFDFENIHNNKISKKDIFFLHKIRDFNPTDSIELQLSDHDLESLDLNSDLIPETFSVFFNVLDDEKESIFINTISSITAAGHISRFSHLDKGIENLLQEIFDYEKQIHSDCLVAEIIHQPTQEIGNLTLRSISRENEIPFHSFQSNNTKNIISIDDLYLHVDSNYELILTSQKYNKRVLPYFSSSYNYMMTEFPLFRFLCDLQLGKDNLTGLQFSWGNIFESFPFLPRITYKNIIFSPAIWKFSGSHLEELKSILADNKAKVLINIFRKKQNLPSLVFYHENESDLLLDLSSINSLNLLKKLIKNQQMVILKETMLAESNTMVHNFSYTNEFIVTAKNNER